MSTISTAPTQAPKQVNLLWVILIALAVITAASYFYAGVNPYDENGHSSDSYELWKETMREKLSLRVPDEADEATYGSFAEETANEHLRVMLNNLDSLDLSNPEAQELLEEAILAHDVGDWSKVNLNVAKIRDPDSELWGDNLEDLDEE